MPALLLALSAAPALAGGIDSRLDGHWAGAGIDLSVDTERGVASDTGVGGAMKRLTVRAHAGAIEMFEIGGKPYFAVVEGGQMRLTSTAFPGEVTLVRLDEPSADTGVKLRGAL